MVADTAALLTAYNVWQNQPEPQKDETLELEVQYVPKETPTAEPPAEPTVPAEPEPPVEPALPEEPAKESAFEWWMVAVALAVFLIGGGGALMLLIPKKLQEKYEKKYEDRIGPS